MAETEKTLFPKVGQIAHLGVYTTSAKTSLKEATKLMLRNEVRDVIFTVDQVHRILTVADLLEYTRQSSDLSISLDQLPAHILVMVHEDENIMNIFPMLDNDKNRYLGVTNQQQDLIGIISYSDVISALDPSIFIKKKTVGEVLQPRHHLQARADTPTREILHHLSNAEHAVIVIDDDKPVGIITAKDVIGIIQNHLDINEPVSRYMSTPVDTVSHERTISQVLDYLQETRFKRAIVVDDKQRLLGVLSQSDLAGFAFNHWTQLVQTHTSALSDMASMLDTKAKRFEKDALNDPLTGIGNRRRFNYAMEAEIGRIKRYHTPSFALIIIDIDHFKYINDQYGHLVGDQILIALVEYGASLLRDTDVFCRWGGEEFTIMLPVTDLEGGRMLAERIRTGIELEGFEGIACSISAGVGEFLPDESMDELVKRVDSALYLAKSSGRNRVELSR